MAWNLVKFTDVSEDHTTYIFRVEEQVEAIHSIICCILVSRCLSEVWNNPERADCHYKAEVLGIYWRIWELWRFKLSELSHSANSTWSRFNVQCKIAIEPLEKSDRTEFKPHYCHSVHTDWQEKCVVISGKQVLVEDVWDCLGKFKFHESV
jgi:hypothetical protein